MKFNNPIPPTVAIPVKIEVPIIPVEVGNIYQSKNTRKTKYWVIIGVEKSSVHCVGINDEGNITSTVSYGRHVFEGYGDIFKPRKLLGKAKALKLLSFDIEWLDN